ncbi:MAG: protein kinase, partial [Ignavibacteriaceae bacterium]
MGVVYLAEDMKLKRKVAIKFLTHHVSTNKQEKKRFEIEAQAAASLNHPNITTIYAIEEADEEVFIVMEYIEGVELKDKIKSESKLTEETINTAVQIAEGLDAAHKKGIIHRDIKSQNIMVTNDGKAKIMDFGLAKLKGGLQITKIGSTVGTVAYMSPEQARGEKVDQRTDIWSFGIVLYEMLTGELPFKGEYEQAIIYSIINENPKPISSVNRVIPIELERIIHKALAKDPANRYQNAAEVISDLKQLLSKRSHQTTTVRKRINLFAGKKLIISGIIVLFSILILILVSILSIEGDHKIKSIAVLPLDNLSHNPEQEYFVDGMTEALITELSKISGLRVISRTSVMQYKDKKEHLPDIAEELDVDAVVEGSALLINNKIRITAQLIDAATDEHIWSNLYDRKLADVLSLHKKVAREIAQEIKIKLSAEEQKNLTGADQVNPKAYELLLKGRYIFKNKSHLEDRLKSIEYYNKAIKIDPGFSLAYAYLANAIRYLIDYGYPPSEVKDQVKQAALKSIELDPNSAIAHMQYGMYKFYFEWDWQTALQE